MMKDFASLDTYYIIGVIAECSSGYIIMGQYIDPVILDDLLQENAFSPCNAYGKLMVITTNPGITPKTELEEVVYVSPADLQRNPTHISRHGNGGGTEVLCADRAPDKALSNSITLYEYLFGNDGEYEDLASDDWSYDQVSCSLGDYNDFEIAEAIQEYLWSDCTNNDVAEYKRLKVKLGL